MAGIDKALKGESRMLRVVKTENGIVRGIEAADPRITAFKGVPFAAPPVGENRWRAPQPAESWEGVLDCSRFKSISMQDTPGLGTDIYCREWHVDPEIPMGEDCLYLNIWTPAKTGEEALPVLVWYFGGGLQWGYTSEMEFDGERMARRGIVVVTVNYRLGAFGFLAHPQLTSEQPDAPTNFGSLDQQAGLNWVRRNIRAFGGDPDCITIAGQSAGGGSVMSQITCPKNKGLIKRAIVQSGIIRSPYMPDGFGRPGGMKAVEENGRIFLEEYLGVDTIERARQLDAFYIRDKYGEYASKHPRFFTNMDGSFVVGDPVSLCAAGDCLDVDIMAGNTVDEFRSFIPAADDKELSAKAEGIFGEKAEKFLALPGARESDGHGRYASVSGIEVTAKAMFSRLKEHFPDKRYYYYRFNPDIPGEDNPGSFHSCELWFMFETLAKCSRPYVGRHYDLARQMCNYWCNFIKTGDPNGRDADGSQMPLWEEYTDGSHSGMTFVSEGSVPEGSDGELVAFLTEHVKNKI